MFFMRREQIEMLEKECVHSLTHRSLLHVKTHYPDQVQDTEDNMLEKIIRKRISMAKEWDIDDDDEILRFVTLSFIIGHDFEKKTGYDWILSILEKHEMPDQNRMDLIFEMLNEAAE